MLSAHVKVQEVKAGLSEKLGTAPQEKGWKGGKSLKDCVQDRNDDDDDDDDDDDGHGDGDHDSDDSGN